MEEEPTEQRRKSSAVDAEVPSTHKAPGKVSEKKRRRSQTLDGSESGLPSKIKKTSESETGEESGVTKSSKSFITMKTHKKMFYFLAIKTLSSC